jgi:hypothetical protein
MRFALKLVVLVILASLGLGQASASTFTYTGKKLIAYRKPEVKGIPHATHLTITAVGAIPAKGQCLQETITSMTDGPNSLVSLMSKGWVYYDGVFDIFKVCSDMKSGKLSANVEVELVAYDSDGNLVADWIVTTPYKGSFPTSNIADLDEFSPPNYPAPYYETDANYAVGKLTYTQ